MVKYLLVIFEAISLFYYYFENLQSLTEFIIVVSALDEKDFFSVVYYYHKSDDSMMETIMKIKTYDYNSIDGNYSFSHYWSAILVDNKRIITNAHVVLDSDWKSPTGYYEVCRSEKSKKIPTCFTTAKLVSYDTIADLAVLELATSPAGVKGVVLADKKELPVATSVIVYGYPSIGWTSITRTEWKIGWTDGLSYKFDGTIDHGNSGGGAFSSDGKLIGMPYAVKSDNGMIWYIIPVSRISDFLGGKTDNIEKSTIKINTTFSTYIKNIQSLYKNLNSIKTKYVEIKNADKNGLTLNNAVSSISGDIFIYYFLDKNSRVSFAVSCSKDASFTWKDPIKLAQDQLTSLQNQKDTKVASVGSFLDSEKTKYMIESVDIKENKWMKSTSAAVVYMNAPTCITMISALDWKNKDKTIYNKAIALAKDIKFFNTQKIQATFDSPAFSLKTIPRDVYLSESLSFLGMNPVIGVVFSTKNMVFSNFELLKFDDIDGYMNYGYSASNKYSGKNYSFDDFYRRYRTTGYDNVSDEIATSKNSKKFIVTTKNFSDRGFDAVKFEKVITFFYPFVTMNWEYRAYKIEFTIKTEDMDVYQVRQLIESLEFPGKSPFKN